MFSTDDTIVAIATPLGRSGIGVVRLSGASSAGIAAALVGRAEPFEPRHATLARLSTSVPGGTCLSPADLAIRDQVVVTWFPGPHSYSGEDVAEISAHGSPIVLQAILRAAVAAGARLAEPGEFTLRAFLHDKLDLVQAEAVGDLIDAVTPLQARAAFDQLEGTLTTAIAAIESELFELCARLEASLDFPDEGYHFVEPHEAQEGILRVRTRIDDLLTQSHRGRMVREGAQVVIVGTPNVGKSSLFNALLNANRAIVTPIAGTTRDLLSERADIGGMSTTLVDTAGIRDACDAIEHEGVSRARGAAAVADLILLVVDRSRPPDPDDIALLATTAGRVRIVVVNKIDLPAAPGFDLANRAEGVEVSVRSGAGIAELSERIEKVLGGCGERRDHPIVTNVRHIGLLERAREALSRAADAIRSSNGTIPEEFILADLQQAGAHLQEVTGRRSTEELLRHIFERFCIGK